MVGLSDVITMSFLKTISNSTEGTFQCLLVMQTCIWHCGTISCGALREVFCLKFIWLINLHSRFFSGSLCILLLVTALTVSQPNLMDLLLEYLWTSFDSSHNQICYPNMVWSWKHSSLKTWRNWGKNPEWCHIFAITVTAVWHHFPSFCYTGCEKYGYTLLKWITLGLRGLCE